VIRFYCVTCKKTKRARRRVLGNDGESETYCARHNPLRLSMQSNRAVFVRTRVKGHNRAQVKLPQLNKQAAKRKK